MEVTQSRLVTSAFQKQQWPDTEVPELILVGRSNVGKSSLINALCHRKNLAYVGKTPGKTRLLNFYMINETCLLVDAPGYGYAAGVKQTFVDFGRMMDDYFRTRRQCRGMVLILDVRRTPSEDDWMMLEYARHHGIPYCIVVSKWDKLPRSKAQQQLQVIAKAIAEDSRKLLPVSANQKTGIEALWQTMEVLLGQEQR